MGQVVPVPNAPHVRTTEQSSTSDESSVRGCGQRGSPPSGTLGGGPQLRRTRLAFPIPYLGSTPQQGIALHGKG